MAAPSEMPWVRQRNGSTRRKSASDTAKSSISSSRGMARRRLARVMAALPMAFIGSVVALVITGQTLTIAAMVGFISLAGIASRNGILLLNHYLHLVKYEGEDWTKPMIVRAGLERLAPVLMTALVASLGFVPMAIATSAGAEVQRPLATVVIGGLITSTILTLLVLPVVYSWFSPKDRPERL